jgi:hypothetical protein
MDIYYKILGSITKITDIIVTKTLNTCTGDTKTQISLIYIHIIYF